jgi:hypothetical protein
MSAKDLQYESGSYHIRLLVSYVARRILRSIFYAQLELRQSKEETYSMTHFSIFLACPETLSDEGQPPKVPSLGPN